MHTNEWAIIQSPTDAEMYAVQGVYLVADKLPIEDAKLIAAAPHMLKSLRKLTAEVGGLRAFEPEIRAELGNTNWAVLMDRLSEADAAIAKALK